MYNPGDAKAHFDLATVYEYMGDSDKAIEYCQEALELTTSLCYEFMAHVYQSAGDYSKAAEYLEKLTEFDDPESAHFIELVNLYEGIGDKNSVLKTLDRMRTLGFKSVADYLEGV